MVVAQFTANTGGSAGTPLTAQILNGLVQAVSYVLSGGTPPTSASLTVTVPATQGVNLVSTGLALWVAMPSTGITLPASNDSYIDLVVNPTTGAGSYVVASVANGASAPAVATNGQRLCKVVTSGSAATAVTDLANRFPLPQPGGNSYLASSTAVLIDGPLTWNDTWGELDRYGWNMALGFTATGGRRAKITATIHSPGIPNDMRFDLAIGPASGTHGVPNAVTGTALGATYGAYGLGFIPSGAERAVSLSWLTAPLPAAAYRVAPWMCMPAIGGAGIGYYLDSVQFDVMEV